MMIRLLCLVAILFAASFSVAQSTQPAKPRVGIIVSKYNAELKFGNEVTGYARMTRVMKEFRDGDFVFIPLIDPGTADDPDVARACKEVSQEKPLELTDSESIAKIDVIVASHIMRIKPEAIDALDKAIQNGTGLLIRMYFGNFEPGINDPTVCALVGLEPGSIKYLKNADIEAQAAQEHPIVGSLASSMERIVISPNGMYGKYTGTPLIEVCDDTNVNAPGRQNGIIAVVYTAQRGKGNIIVCPFAGSKAIPPKLDKAGDKPFGTRCLIWFVEQKHPATQPAEK